MLFEGTLTWLLTYRYLVIVPLIIIEGPIVMVVSGFLLRLGYFAFWPVYLVLLLGDLAGDFIWYGVGYYGARRLVRRYGHFLSLTDEVMDRIEEVFKKYQNKILFTSKVTMGLGFALVTLITAGAVRVPLKNYAAFNILGGFVWTSLLVALGYFFGNLYFLVDEAFRLIFLAALAAVFLIALYGFKRYIKQQIIKDKT